MGDQQGRELERPRGGRRKEKEGFRTKQKIQFFVIYRYAPAFVAAVKEVNWFSAR